MSEGRSGSDADRRRVEQFLERSDEAAFRELYAAETPRLYLWLLRLTGGREAEAEELLQETWIRGIASLPGFRWESSLSTWLHGIAWNVASEERRRRASVTAPRGVASDDPVLADLRADGEPARLDLERAVRRLPEGFREVFVLHDLEGYTHEEIAGILGIAVGTSKSQLSRARVHLRREIAASSERPGRASHDRT